VTTLQRQEQLAKGAHCARRAKSLQKGLFAAKQRLNGAMVTLIDGDKLIDLLIEYGIGVKKNKIEVLSVDADCFADLEPEA
jgi:restriction endonuclease Mrr